MSASGFRLPDFLIGGAPRSGTTWLRVLLEKHPQICMAQPAAPEPKFFLVDDLYRRGLEYYARTWFGNVPAGCVTGEKSTNYLESSIAAQRIRQDLPEVNLVFIFRNPVERAYSNYLWSCKNGLEAEEFRVALAQRKNARRRCPRHCALPGRTRYWRGDFTLICFGPISDSFQRKQILCLRFEDIAERPAHWLPGCMASWGWPSGLRMPMTSA